jgi:hypothetical protein
MYVYMYVCVYVCIRVDAIIYVIYKSQTTNVLAFTKGKYT